MSNKRRQDLSKFRVPDGFRGRSAWFVQLWWLVQATVFRHSPQLAYGFRAWLLRCFGAKVGVNTVIRPKVTITYPWKVSIGDFSWIGDDAVLYSLGEIEVQAHAVISQRSYLCAGDHDYRDASFPIRGRPIIIEEQAWLAADVFVAPGTVVGRGAVVGARSSVFQDLPAWTVCVGSPCRPVKPRESN
ncbi:putative colanic acid biosynthesis acetyltransferase [Burkholderia vietnamiensis]|uniref:putative colanic acid biosynthesis acetyltransferase n=1 Tax=Burkholderia vietnamiensis TaxID=60552 RepID=UPI0009C19AE2|nr:putative colanic acid biosynthesis acetyltransferase [Burkholderia vietnamiensis]MDN7927598.1 putative colanic acid biosynthesis acetyltransferase [Burkholderia vietnamiensis]HDR9251110.1 colanic acid biosynthesis acetyltransferase WcaF [Burkholderia vietnamiensis]